MRMIPVYAGLDYHGDSVRVCVMTVAGEELFNRSVSNVVGDVVAVAGRCRERARLRLGTP